MTQWIHFTAILMVFGVAVAVGQQNTADPAVNAPRYDLALGYNYIGANAPPGNCHCFAMHGGFFSAGIHFNDWLSIEGKVTGGHSNDISALGQNLTLTTFTVGPRFTWHHGRFAPYGEALFGAAWGTGSYFPRANGTSTTSASSVAYSVGGGLEYELTPRMAVLLPDAEFLHTALPNGINGEQNTLEIGAGVVFKFGNRTRYIPAPPMHMPAKQVDLSCTQSAEQVPPGEPLEIIAQAITWPGNDAVDYDWHASAGTVQGSGSMVSIETAGLEPGTYHVYGTAHLADDAGVHSDCQVSFTIVPPQKAKVITRTIVEKPATNNPAMLDFEKNIQDAFFDYNQYNLRPDAQSAIAHDASYLESHPDIHITIAGFADERGTAEYNIWLGLQRALAVRRALAKDGIDMGRMNVLSYGKEKQFCSDQTPACFQQNRRAHFMMDPLQKPQP
ncbi:MULTISPECIES: outer membrane beta-barrel protein [Acidobacterium]|nr:MULTISPECIES: outer membrane beta-barrel protein [Acidobacterium]